MKLSVIIPTLNEEHHIKALITSIKDIDQTEKEIIIVDGGSTDHTRNMVLEISKNTPNVILVENPDKYVSQGFNRAFKVSKGQYISLVGAHAVYPQNYFSVCIDHIERGEAEVAGGVLLHKGTGIFGQAIAKCMSSKFGVGNTEFRTQRKKMLVDSVAFAVYDRKVFNRVGLFNEELVRNQDDEFHYRLNQAGLRILMLPEIETSYFVRNSLPKLFSQYYQYGFYKPLVFKKVKKSIRPRHLIPAAFVLYLLSLPLAIFWPLWLVPLGIYVLFDLFFGLLSKSNWESRLAALLVYPTLHIAYGAGYLRGLWHWNLNK